jgi:sensor histidine kinase regulating citrate/malate metabolism
MSKNPVVINGLSGQQKMIQATKDAGVVAMESAQAINQINQQAAQELTSSFQKRVHMTPKVHLMRSTQKYCRTQPKKFLNITKNY